MEGSLGQEQNCQRSFLEMKVIRKIANEGEGTIGRNIIQEDFM